MNNNIKSKTKEKIKEVVKILNSESLNYRIYGSFAFHIYTGNDIDMNDLDIVVSKNDFSLIESIFNELENFKVYVYENSIHINCLDLLNNNKEAFDLSFDSYEHYIEMLEISKEEYNEIIVEDINMKFLKKDDLIKVYEYAVKKYPEKESYFLKLKALNS